MYQNEQIATLYQIPLQEQYNLRTPSLNRWFLISFWIHYNYIRFFFFSSFAIWQIQLYYNNRNLRNLWQVGCIQIWQIWERQLWVSQSFTRSWAGLSLRWCRWWETPETDHRCPPIKPLEGIKKINEGQ